MMIAAPITQAQMAPGPAICAARHAPNSQPEPMIEPRPVSIRANGPTSRRIWLAWDMEAPVRALTPKKEPDGCRVQRLLSSTSGHGPRLSPPTAQVRHAGAQRVRAADRGCGALRAKRVHRLA